jgi:glycosyltransferase involved in cell wall biosynthesis
MSSTRVSVISVTRNDLLGIQQTVASVLEQNYPYVEHIVVDGASTDGTVEWLAERDWESPSRFVSERDNGIYDAMNKGAELATGDVIVFLNGGDRFPDAGTVTRVVKDHDTHSWDWAYGITVLENADGSVSRIHQMAPFSKVRLGLGLAAVPHQSLWMETGFFQALGSFRVDAGLSADMDLCWRAAQQSAPRLIPGILAIASEGGVSARQSPGYYARAMRRNIKHYGDTVTGNQVFDAIAATGVTAVTAVVQIIPTLWAKREFGR